KVGFPTRPSLIGDSRPGMPAWEAGITAGDKVDRINGSAITTFTDLQMSVALSSGALRLEGTHADGTPFDVVVDPDATRSHPQIGVIPMESLTVYDTLQRRVPKPGEPTIQKGDVVTKVGENDVHSAIEFHRLVAANKQNPLTITVERTQDKEGHRLPQAK